MRAVGIKILKAKLSEYLRLVKTGEVVLVTEHDQVIAELRPAHRQEAPATLDDLLAVLATKGELIQRSEEFGEWNGMKSAIKLDGLSSKEILDSLRGEN